MKSIITGTFNRLPAPLMVILAIICTNTGVALSKNLFISIGVIGTVSLQIAFGAIILCIVTKPKLHNINRKTGLLIFLNGLALCVAETSYFLAVARLPLGVAVTIGFCGPLALALFGSRTFLDAVWLVLAGIGLFMIAPIHEFQQGTSAIGYLFALLYAVSLCLSIVTCKLLSKTVKQTNLDGLQAIAASLVVSAIIIMPFGIHSGGANLFNPSFLLEALGLGLITVVLSYSFQYISISKLTTKSFGILSSARPVVAAALGVFILGDTINTQQLISFSLIITASVGSIVRQDKTTLRPKTSITTSKIMPVSSTILKTH